MVRMRYNQRLNATDFTHYCNQLSILYYTRTIIVLLIIFFIVVAVNVITLGLAGSGRELKILVT